LETNIHFQGAIDIGTSHLFSKQGLSNANQHAKATRGFDKASR
jgi:hypothetical protein